MPDRFISELKSQAAKIAVELSDGQAASFLVYRRLLYGGGSPGGLTAVPEERCLQEHFIDSLTACGTGKFRAGLRVADIGAGAGFPGVPIKIAVPEIEVFLVEPNAKKAAFLRRLVLTLGLAGVGVLEERVENIGCDPQYREKMDVVVARAVAALPVLLEYALPLLKPGGWFLALKGPRVKDEIGPAETAAGRLGGRIESTHSPVGVAPGVNRVIVQVQKVRETPPGYPRRVGVPAKRPLGGYKSEPKKRQ